MVKLFGDVRDQWIASDLDGWLAPNRIYTGVAEPVAQAVAKDEVYIVTTKQVCMCVCVCVCVCACVCDRNTVCHKAIAKSSSRTTSSWLCVSLYVCECPCIVVCVCVCVCHTGPLHRDPDA